MSGADKARFEHWLENYATDDERSLPYEQQVMRHILWLSGEGPLDLALLQQGVGEELL